MRVKVLVAEGPLRTELEPLPAAVELVATPAPDVEVALIGAERAHELDGLFRDLPGQRVVLSLNAGVEWLVPHVPEGSRDEANGTRT